MSTSATIAPAAAQRVWTVVSKGSRPFFTHSLSGAGLTLLATYPCCCVSEKQKAVKAELTVCEIWHLEDLTDNIKSPGLNQGKLITSSGHCTQFRPNKCLISFGWSLNKIQLICCGSSLQCLNFPIQNTENIYFAPFLDRWVYSLELWEFSFLPLAPIPFSPLNTPVESISDFWEYIIRRN